MLKVNVPAELEGIAFIQVVIQKESEQLVSANICQSGTFDPSLVIHFFYLAILLPFKVCKFCHLSIAIVFHNFSPSQGQLSLTYCISSYKTLPRIIPARGCSKTRAVARYENLGGHIVLGGDNVPPLVEIGLTDLTKNIQFQTNFD